MCSCGLTNLKSFPNLPKLKKLDLTDNKISGGLDHLFGSQKLKALFLNGNKIDSIEVLEPLKNFENLTDLFLGDCEVTKIENYREKIFALLPKLKYLEGFDKNNQEADDTLTEEEMLGEESEDEKSNEVGLEYLENTIDKESEGADKRPEEKESDDNVIEVNERETDDEESSDSDVIFLCEKTHDGHLIAYDGHLIEVDESETDDEEDGFAPALEVHSQLITHVGSSVGAAPAAGAAAAAADSGKKEEEKEESEESEDDMGFEQTQRD